MSAATDRRVTRARRAGARPKRSIVLTAVMTLILLYSVFPLFWLVVNSTKSMTSLFDSVSLWFAGDFALWDNIVGVVTYHDGEYVRWFLNTIGYAAGGAGGAAFIAAIGGYGLAKFDFPGRRAIFAVVIAAVAVPATALTVPTFLLFSTLGLTNTPFAVILPSLVTPFGLFLMWTYAANSVPSELLEAARLDGAGELHIFFTIGFRLMVPGFVAVLLLELVQSWNNFFLPLIMLNDSDLLPLTVGLNQWNSQAAVAGGDTIFNLVLTGSLLMIIPIVIAFLLLQRFWQAGLTAGSIK